MSETQSAGIDAVLKRPDQVLVFISYSHDDKDLADCLRDELRDIRAVSVGIESGFPMCGKRWSLGGRFGFWDAP
jgi:hypothetical protein